MTIRAEGFPPNQVGADHLTEATDGIGISKDEAKALSWLTQYPEAVTAVASVIRKARGAYLAPGRPPVALVRDGWPCVGVSWEDELSEDLITVEPMSLEFHGGQWLADEARDFAAALLRAADLTDAGYGRVAVVDGAWHCWRPGGFDCGEISAARPCPSHGTVPPAGPGFRFVLVGGPSDLSGGAAPSEAPQVQAPPLNPALAGLTSGEESAQ